MRRHRIARWLGVIVLTSTMLSSGGVTAGTFPASSKDELKQIERRVLAAHFLSRASFGPTLEEIDALAGSMDQLGTKAALEAWIDLQFSLPPTHHEALALQMIADDGFDPLQEGIGFTRYKHHAWWHAAIAAPDQLRQRVAWALMQIFVVNEFDSTFDAQTNDASGMPQHLGVANYYDMLVDNAFGNYRELLEDVTLHPIMGVFLSHARNPKGDPSIGRFPDENFAREVMQLLTIGLYELKRDGVVKRRKGREIDTYDNDTIRAFARVFTGLSFSATSSFTGARSYHQPMRMFEEFHDTDEKELLGGVVLPAGQSGMQDIRDALDNLFQHPNVPPFVARLLIQRFVRSNPSRGYIGRVARAFENKRGARGDLKPVIKAILLDKEALQSQSFSKVNKPLGVRVVPKGTDYSRLREPVLRYAAMLRAFRAAGDRQGGRAMIPALAGLNQAAYRSPSIFNFYLPDHRPSGDILDYIPSKRIPNRALVAPEFEIFTSAAANPLANLFRDHVQDGIGQFFLAFHPTIGYVFSRVYLDFSREIALAREPAELLTHLDLLLCHGSLSDETKRIVADIVEAEASADTDRASGAVLAVLTSPECAVAN